MKASRLLIVLGVWQLSYALGDPVSDFGNTISDGITSATDAVDDAVGSAAAVVQNATAAATDAVNSAAGTAQEAFNSSQNALVQQTQHFEADIGNLTQQLGDDLAAYVNNVVLTGQRHPMVFWPAFGTSRLHVEVKGSTVQNCPSSGSFDVAFGQPTILAGFPEACIYPLLQMQFDAGAGTITNAPGVSTSIYDFGGQFCAAIPYEPLFAIAQAIGYTAGKDFMVACYDWRTTPYADVGTDGAHLARARQLVEQAYANSGGLPVYLLGHSNGPLYALALLRTMTVEWRAKYVAGFISYAGNWMGQGITFSQLFSGGSLFDNRVYPAAAPAYESWPSTYTTASTPAYYGASEVVIRTTNATGGVAARDYTPADALQLFQDAGLRQAQALGPLLLGNASANSTPPGTHFYGFIGTDVQTQVGSTYATLQQQQAPAAGGDIFSGDGGDGNQENTDNIAVAGWAQLQDPCFHFELNKKSGAEHLTLPFNPGVVKRTVEILFSAPAQCGVAARASAPAVQGLPAAPVKASFRATEALG